MDDVLIPNVEDLISENPAVGILSCPAILSETSKTESLLGEGLISREYVPATLSGDWEDWYKGIESLL